MHIYAHVRICRLGAPGGFFAKLVPVVVKNFSDAVPELLSRQEYVQMVSVREVAHMHTYILGCIHIDALI